MKQFLRETWQLWYWAHYCPSKLQQRMNEWAPAEEEDGNKRDTRYFYILLRQPSLRFIIQFFLLMLILSSPLILSIVLSDQPLGWWLVVAMPLIAYGLSICSFLPFALDFPLLFTLLYLSNTPLLYQALTKVLAPFPPLSYTLQTAVMGVLGLIAISSMGYGLWLAKQIKLGRLVLVVGNALSYAGAVWFVSQSNLLSILTMLLVGGIVYILVINEPKNIKDTATKTTTITQARVIPIFGSAAVAGTIVGTIVGAITVSTVGFGAVVGAVIGVVVGVVVSAVIGAIIGGIIGVIIGGLIGVVVGPIIRVKVITVAQPVAIVGFGFGAFAGAAIGIFMGVVAGSVAIMVLGSLPLPLLSLVGWLIGNSFAIRPQHSWGIGAAVVLALLAIEQQGPFGLLVILPTLIGYYRLADYFVLSVISLWRANQLGYNLSNLLFGWRPVLQGNNNIPIERLWYWLYTLPPHMHELLWVPLPGHDRILAAAFRADAQVAFKTWQQMRTLPHPGLPLTAQRALLQIVSDQLLALTSVNELINTLIPEHPIFGLYQPEEENFSAETLFQFVLFSPVDAETGTMLPHLQKIARDVRTALEGGSADLRERGLGGVLKKTVRLKLNLIKMTLDSSAIARWQAVLEHWQVLIQHELEQQQAASQGEVVNPFQSGNPLRVDRQHLFKGRQQFADDILRQVLSRSRPTLVLHGPRRCGKSSFLYNLSRLLPSDLIPVYLDLQDGALISSEGDFCYGLVRAMGRDMRSQGLNPPAANRHEFRASPYAALEDWLDGAELLLEERRFLLCLDEFEELGNTIREGIISERLLKHLRHLIQHREELNFLFCGVQTLDELGPNWSSYFISVEPVEMLYLEPKEARELLEDPDPEFNLGYETGIVDEVLQITRCQPYLVQLIGEAMVKQANQHHTGLITSPLLQAALERALTAGQPYFTNLWDEYTGAFDNPDQVAAGRRFLHALAHDLPRTLPDEIATRHAIRRMERYHLIEQDETGAYRFEVPFVERWVRERAVLG